MENMPANTPKTCDEIREAFLSFFEKNISIQG